MFFFHLKVKQKNSTRAELAQLVKQSGESDLSVSPDRINKIQKNTNIHSLVEGSKTASLTNEKPSKNETEENDTPILVDISLQKEVKSIKSPIKSHDSPTLIVEDSTPAEKMKRSSSSEYFNDPFPINSIFYFLFL